MISLTRAIYQESKFQCCRRGIAVCIPHLQINIPSVILVRLILDPSKWLFEHGRHPEGCRDWSGCGSVVQKEIPIKTKILISTDLILDDWSCVIMLLGSCILPGPYRLVIRKYSHVVSLLYLKKFLRNEISTTALEPSSIWYAAWKACGVFYWFRLPCNMTVCLI
jgi:hypothetical protein